MLSDMQVLDNDWSDIQVLGTSYENQFGKSLASNPTKRKDFDIDTC